MKYYLMYWKPLGGWEKSGYFAQGTTDINKAYECISTLGGHYIVVEENNELLLKYQAKYNPT